MARKTSYDRMYREYDVKSYENNLEPKVEEKIPEEIVEEKKEDVVKEEVKQSVIGTVIGGSLNVRKNPNGEVITSINDGSQVTIVDDSDPEWHKISSPVSGYVMKRFVRT